MLKICYLHKPVHVHVYMFLSRLDHHVPPGPKPRVQAGEERVLVVHN